MEGKLCMRKIDFATVFGVKVGNEIVVKEVIGPFDASKPVEFTSDTVVYDAELDTIKDGFNYYYDVKELVETSIMGIFGKKVHINDVILVCEDRRSLVIMTDEYAVILTEGADDKAYMALLNLSDKKIGTVESMVDMSSILELTGYDKLLHVISTEVGSKVVSILFHAIKHQDGFTANLIKEVYNIVHFFDIDSDLVSLGSLKGRLLIRDGSMAFVIKHTKDGLKREDVRQTFINVVKGLDVIHS